MFKHYLTTALRHFRLHKVTTSINVVCLAIGLSCFLAAHWLVTSARSADTYFSNSDRIFVVSLVAAAGSGAGVERPHRLDRGEPSQTVPELEVIARASDGVESARTRMPTSAGDAAAFTRIAMRIRKFRCLRFFLTGDAKNALRQPRCRLPGAARVVRRHFLSSGTRC
jgi:hypothetical protein